MSVEVRVEVVPRWAFRLPLQGGMDGVLRRRGSMVERLLHLSANRPVIVRVAQTSSRSVLFGAWAPDRAAAEWGIARMRFALAVDDDLRPFYDLYRDDPLIGAAVRRHPGRRIRRRPLPYEAFAWAVTEQLIQYVEAARIQRRMVRAVGRRCASGSGLVDAPTAVDVGALSPARLESWGLSGRRSLALVKASREIARGRIDLDDHERSWKRLQAIPTIGPWTTEVLACNGQGRYDQLPAGDLAYIKLVGWWQSGGDPRARADEADVRALFARFGEWKALAAAHALRAPMPLPALLAA